MESQTEGAPLTAEGSESAGTLVLERPGVALDDAFGAGIGPLGPTVAAPSGGSSAAPSVASSSAAPVGGAPEDARPRQTPVDPRIWEVLAGWRAAIRSIAIVEPDSSAWYARHAELVGLRALYHTLFDEAAAAAIPPRRMVLVGPPRPAGDEGVVGAEDASVGGAAVHDSGA